MLVMIGAEMLGLSPCSSLELLFLSRDLEPPIESLARANGICCLTLSPFSPLDSLVAERRCELEARVSLSFFRLELLDT